MISMGNGGGGIFMVFLAIAMGMGGELHIHVPGLGFLAMLDFVAYILAVPILMSQWSSMGKYMRRSLAWAMLWTFAAVLSNATHYYNFMYWAKCVSLASSSWALIAVAYFVLKKYPKMYIWYLVGAGLGGWIALYHFRNGAYEAMALQRDVIGSGEGIDMFADKQIYPSIAKGVLLGLVLPVLLLWKKFPSFVVIVVTLFAGYWLLTHGGSRSSFGVFCASSLAGFGVAYGKKTFQSVGKHPFLFLLALIIGASLLLGVYKFMAKSGAMGEGERAKYEREFNSGRKGALNSRSGIDAAFCDAVESGGIGLGGHLRRHSVAANALSCEGVIGGAFWLYFMAQVLWWLGKRAPYSGKYSTFIILMILAAVWDVVGSPFSTRHKFFVLMAFIALCRDNPYYGFPSLFDAGVLSGQRSVGPGLRRL